MDYKAKNNNVLHILSILCCSGALLLGGCATTGTTDSSKSSKVDPFEDFNRSIFSFNKTLDEYIAEPVVDAYTWVTPNFVQTGIGNFFSNLKDINVVINDILQAKFLQSGEDTGRFLVNTTLGLGGLFDVATELDLVKHVEDFDQTFAVWGIPQGPYLVLPVLGPITSRGVSGKILDTAANPAFYVPAPIQLLDMLNTRANVDGSLKVIDEASMDPYIFTRESFLQARKHLITDGKSDLTDDVLDTDESTTVKGKNTDIKGYQEAIKDFENTTKSFDSATRTLKSAADKIKPVTK